MSTATQRLAPRRGSRRGPTVERRRIRRRNEPDARFVPVRGELKVATLEDALLLTMAAIGSGNPAPCLVCDTGVMTADGCESCGSRLD